MTLKMSRLIFVAICVVLSTDSGKHENSQGLHPSKNIRIGYSDVVLNFMKKTKRSRNFIFIFMNALSSYQLNDFMLSLFEIHIE